MTVPDPGFTTPEMSTVFSPKRRLAAMLTFEAALAQASADLGLLSPDTANEIAIACDGFDGDPDAIADSTWERGTPLLALLEAIKPALSAEAAVGLHRGATSQDAIDTALMLQIREACEILERDLKSIAELLVTIAQTHRATPFMARTLLQHALPTTFGLRAAQWLDPILKALLDLGRTCSSLPLQLGGPAGNLATFGSSGVALLEAVAGRLGLVAPSTPWHTDRSHVRQPIEIAVSIALAMDKIASDLVLLAHLGEVRMRAGESSSMAHKHNPIDAVRAVAAARACVAASSALSAPGGRELERGVGAWQVEWWAVPLVLQAAAASAFAVKVALSSLEVSVDLMKQKGSQIDEATLEATSDLIDRVISVASSVLG